MQLQPGQLMNFNFGIYTLPVLTKTPRAGRIPLRVIGRNFTSTGELGLEANFKLNFPPILCSNPLLVTESIPPYKI
jgi:hypothetical protein